MKLPTSAPRLLRRTRSSSDEIDGAVTTGAPVSSDAVDSAKNLAAPTGVRDSSISSDSDSALETEAALVEAGRQDPHAFAILYERYVDRIYAYVYHRVGNVHDAEDLTARTFYRALERLEQYEDRGLPFSAWLFRIAHNLVANWYRDRQRRRFLSLDKLWGHSHDGDSPEGQVEREARQAALWSAIDRLPEERRNLLLLKFGGQLTNVEIGEFLNKSESAVKSLYFRTLASLREDLESRGWGADAPEPDEAMADERPGGHHA